MNENKKTIYLHIGMPKAGSKTLQYFCLYNKEKLNKSGIIYPLFVNKNTKTESTVNYRIMIYCVLQADSKKLHFKEYNYYFENVIAPVLHNCIYDKIFFSEEAIWGEKLSPEICDIMHKCNFNVKIIAYLKRPAEFMTSTWQQQVKSYFSFKKSLNEYLKENINYEILEQYIDKLGKENVIIRPFEKEQWKNEDLCHDFMDCLETKMFDNPTIQEQNNKPYNRDLAEFIQILKNSVSSEEEYYNLLYKYTTLLISDKEKDILTPENINLMIKFLEDYQSSNESLKIINTISDDTIYEITTKNIPILKKIARIYGKEDFFIDYFPKCYKSGKNKDYTGLIQTPKQQKILSEALFNKKNRDDRI